MPATGIFAKRRGIIGASKPEISKFSISSKPSLNPPVCAPPRMVIVVAFINRSDAIHMSIQKSDNFFKIFSSARRAIAREGARRRLRAKNKQYKH